MITWSHQALQWSQSLQLLSRALQTSLQRLEVAWAACAKACGTWWQAGQATKTGGNEAKTLKKWHFSWELIPESHDKSLENSSYSHENSSKSNISGCFLGVPSKRFEPFKMPQWIGDFTII